MAELLAGGIPDEKVSQRQGDAEAEARRRSLWNAAIQHSKQQFERPRLWRVLMAETKTSEVMIRGTGLSAGYEASKQIAKATPIVSRDPVPFKFFVRQRLRKNAPAEWVEAIFDFVDPLDYNSPKAWRLELSAEQIAQRNESRR